MFTHSLSYKKQLIRNTSWISEKNKKQALVSLKNLRNIITLIFFISMLFTTYGLSNPCFKEIFQSPKKRKNDANEFKTSSFWQSLKNINVTG